MGLVCRDGLSEFEVISDALTRPQVSVLMPVYQQERYVKAAIESVLAQANVCLEVIVSDDASTDQTPVIARETLKSARCAHRLVFRSGQKRLWRDHLPLLEEVAVAEVLMQCHGDDLCYPERASKMLRMFSANGVNLVAAACRIIDQDGNPKGIVRKSTWPLETIGMEDVLQFPFYLFGAVYAWRRGASKPFGRLDTSIAPVSHDRIMPFRAALNGKVWVWNEPLLDRRKHTESGSNELFDNRGPETQRFGVSLYRLSACRVFRRDLNIALDSGMIDTTIYNSIMQKIEAIEITFIKLALDEHDALIRKGLLPFWRNASDGV